MAAKTKSGSGIHGWIVMLKPEHQEIARAIRKLILEAEPAMVE